MAHPILQQFIPFTEFLSRILGPDYEIILHDLSVPEHSVIAIANGTISNSRIDDPVSEDTLRILREGRQRGESFIINYTTISGQNGRLLRSSMFMIKTNDNRVVGLMLINFNDSRYHELSEKILKLCHPDRFVENRFVYDHNLIFQESAEEYGQSVAQSAQHLIETALRERGLPSDRLTTQEKLEIVAVLDQKDFFILKGASDLLAKSLHCSRASIYRYRKISKNHHKMADW